MSILENVRAVIFDLDGTLIDTEKIYAITWPKAVKDLGYEMSYEQYLQLRSLGRPYAPAKLREWYGEAFDYQRAKEIRKGYFKEIIDRDGIEQKAGAIELLTFLKKQGIITAIATATDLERATAYMKMAGIWEYFDRVISATMVDEGKPSPKVYQYACQELGLMPAECVAVEDAPNGIRSAYAAGLRVIMVPDQTGPTQELAPMLTACVKRLDEIKGLL